MIKMYGLTKCSTCIKAQKWFAEHSLPFIFSDYREHALKPTDLKAWADELGGWPKLINRASLTWRNLPPEQKDPDTDAQWLDLISAFPALIRRPLIIDQQGRPSVGFAEKKFAERFL